MMKNMEKEGYKEWLSKLKKERDEITKQIERLEMLIQLCPDEHREEQYDDDEL